MNSYVNQTNAIHRWLANRVYFTGTKTIANVSLAYSTLPCPVYGSNESAWWLERTHVRVRSVCNICVTDRESDNKKHFTNRFRPWSGTFSKGAHNWYGVQTDSFPGPVSEFGVDDLTLIAKVSVCVCVCDYERGSRGIHTRKGRIVTSPPWAGVRTQDDAVYIFAVHVISGHFGRLTECILGAAALSVGDLSFAAVYPNTR